MSNLTLYKNDEPRPEMDDMLRDYFQSEMPQPWPAFKAPRATHARETPSLWSRYSGRLALAACIALLAAGYWSISGTLPSVSSPNLEVIGRPTASKERKGRVNTPEVRDHVPHDELVPMGPTPRSK